MDEVAGDVVIGESAPGVVVVGVVVVGVVVVGAEPGAVGAALGMRWMGGVVGLMVVVEAEPGAVGAALGMRWMGGVVGLMVVVVGLMVVAEAEPGAVGAALGMGVVVGVTRLVTASQPSRAARSCPQRRSLLAASRCWTSACAVAIAGLLVVSLDLQVFRERCHEPVTLCERRARLVGRLPDEDLHPRKGAPRCGVAGIAQLIDRIAGDLCDGVHAEDRSTEALDRIRRAEVVWRSMARGRVVEMAMVRHRRSQARAWSSLVPSQARSEERRVGKGCRGRWEVEDIMN